MVEYSDNRATGLGLVSALGFWITHAMVPRDGGLWLVYLLFVGCGIAVLAILLWQSENASKYNTRRMMLAETVIANLPEHVRKKISEAADSDALDELNWSGSVLNEGTTVPWHRQSKWTGVRRRIYLD